MLLVLSQTLPSARSIEEAVDVLVAQGVLGSLCLLLIVALVVAVKALVKSKDDRVKDQQEMQENTQEIMDVSNRLKTEMHRDITNILMDVNRNYDRIINKLKANDKSLENLTRTVSDMQRDQDRLMDRLRG